MAAANGWQAQPQSRIMHTGSMCFQGWVQLSCGWILKMLDINGHLLPLSSLSLSYAQTRTQESWHGAFHISQNTAQHLSRRQKDDRAGRRGRGVGRGTDGGGARRGVEERARQRRSVVCFSILPLCIQSPKVIS